MANNVMKWNALVQLMIFLMISCSPSSNGLKFARQKYVILLTMNTPKGGIATIQVQSGPSDVSYSCVTKTQLLNIDKKSGKIMLLKKMDKQTANLLNNTKLTIQAAMSTKPTTTRTLVIIIILKQYYGDQFVNGMIKKARRLVQSNHVVIPKAGHPIKVTAAALHRFLRKVPESAKATAMAQMRIEKAIELIKRKIIGYFEKLFGKNAMVYSYIHIEELVSEKMMKHVESEECRKPTVARICSLRTPYRTFDGTCNNLYHPNFGASNRAFFRILPAKYFDASGLNDPIGYPNQPNAPSVPSPFKISRDFIKDEVAASSSPTLTHAVMQFGQFLDHDFDLAVDSEDSDKCHNVSCDGSPSDFEAPCYPILPHGGSTHCIRVIRSAAVCQEKKGYVTREQLNTNTAFVDASQIYGSTDDVAKNLRQTGKDDQGLLRSSKGLDGELPPLDTSDNPNGELCRDLGGCFLAGDNFPRPNEQQALASFHSLFLREHNRIAKELKSINNHWNGEEVYQETRKIVGAVWQKITFEDYLPVILGPKPLPVYRGYDRKVDPGISNAFATAAFRFGHSSIRPEFDILDNNFDPVGRPIKLRFMFFNNTFIQRNGVEPLLYGLVGNFSEIVDRTLSPGIIRHLFERENSPGQNLAALNIQRSRDHGLPGYNSYRKFCGLSDAKTFEDTKNEIKDPVNRKILKRLYNDDPSLTELWVAGLAETPVVGASVGPTFKCIIADQLRRARDGDRFYYERRGIFSRNKLKEIKKSSLSRIYCDNLKSLVSIQRNAFLAPTLQIPRISCERIPGINLCAWKVDKYFKQPCRHGLIQRARGKIASCSCKCIEPWDGSRCERKAVKRAIPWHATILAGKKVKCSGALITRRHVITTRRCVRGLRPRDITVRLGKYRSNRRSAGEVTARIASVHFPTKYFSPTVDIALLRLRKPVRYRRSIQRIAIGIFWPSRLLTSHLTAWGGGYLLQHVELNLAKQGICKKIFKPFSTTKNICTLKASLPSLPNKLNGSPLVQFRRCKPGLIGLLSSYEAVNSKYKSRFASYIRPSKFLAWIRRTLRKRSKSHFA